MNRVDHAVWKSAIDERELLRLERQTGEITIPVCHITLTQLRELQRAADECLELAGVPRLAEPPEGGAK